MPLPDPLLCPYISANAEEPVYCVQAICQMWNPVTEDCSHKNNPILAKLDTMDERLAIVEERIDLVLPVIGDHLIHMHLQHLHPFTHVTDELGFDFGTNPWFHRVSASNILANIFMQELANGQDLDGNNLIFGTDFILVGDDVPFILKNSSQLKTPPTSAIPVTWDNAMAGIFT
jgi:hypothetical protein